jgi:zinc transport system substrate-binding protein
MRRHFALLALATLTVPTAACSATGGANDGRFTVAAAFYPIEEIVRSVGGDLVHVVTLVPPGQEAHEYDPTPKQVTALEDADVAVYLGRGFQPNVEKAIDSLRSSVRRVDVLDGITLLPVTDQGSDGIDPHVWLDPGNMQEMTTSVLTAFQGSDPAHAQTYADNAGKYLASLGALDRDVAAGLQRCDSTLLVTTHRAFGYLAAAYGLTQIAIAGISPTEEPSAKTLESVARYARANDVRTVFSEQNLPKDLANTLAEELGIGTAVLDTVESPSRDQLAAGADYVSSMRANLHALRAGLRCA